MNYVIDDFAGNERTAGKLSLNATVRAALQRPHEEDWFAVRLEAGVTYYLNVNSFSPADIGELGLAFFDPRLDRTVAAASGSLDKEFALEFTPAASGIYYALAAELLGNWVVSEYTLQLTTRSSPDDLSGDVRTEGVLTVDAPARGVFEQRGDVDWFKFHAEKGYRYTFAEDLQAHSEPVAGIMSSIRIVDTSTGTVRSAGGGFSPTETGDYYIAVDAAREGTYGLVAKQWKDDFPENERTEGHLTSGKPVQGHIDYQMDRDWLRVDFEKGKFYSFTLQSNKDFVFDMQLYDGTGKMLDYSSGYINDGLHLNYQAAETGVVYLAVERDSLPIIDYAMPYSVSLAVGVDDIGQGPADAGNLAIGSGVHGTLQMNTDRDAFKISLDAGVSYRFGLAADGGGQDFELELANVQGGAILATKSVGSEGGLEFTPSSAGEYLLTVGSDGWIRPGMAYALTAERASDDWAANLAGAGQLAVGGGITGRLESAADRDWYAVRLEAGITYWIAASPDGATQTALSILDAAGEPLLSYPAPLNSYPLSFKPDSGGTYYVQIASQNQTSGAYTITAAIGTPDDAGDSVATATPLAAGAAVNGHIEVASDGDVFRLDVLAGQSYVVKLNDPESSRASLKLSDASARISTGFGPAIGSWDQSTSFLAETTGTVYVTVHGYAVGAYQIQVQAYLDDHPDLASATATQLREGQSIDGKLERSADHDVFSMQLDADRPYVLKIKSTIPDGAPPILGFGGGGGVFVLPATQTVENGERIVKFTPQSAGQYFLDLKSADFRPCTYSLSVLPFAGDGHGPTLVAQSFADHALNVPLTQDTFSLKFSEPIVIERDAIVLRDSAGKEVSLEFGEGERYPLVKGDTLTIKVGHNFLPDTYTLSLPSASIHDQAGNRYAGPESLSFTTVLPVDRPGPGNDLYVMKPGAVIDGGAGLDTLSVGGLIMFDFVVPDGKDYIVFDSGSARIRNIERLIFTDLSYALDVDGVAGQAYRLYQAAFDRAPDLPGLGFWIAQMDRGVAALEVADAFVRSPEFTRLYGTTLQDTAFVQTLYQNVLHRSPDAEGFDFWVHALQSGVSRADVLLQFSDSPENQSALAEIIGSGFIYQSIWQF